MGRAGMEIADVVVAEMKNAARGGIFRIAIAADLDADAELS